MSNMTGNQQSHPKKRPNNILPVAGGGYRL